MADEHSNKSSRIQSYAKVEAMVQIALSIPSGIFVGWLCGGWLDRHYRTDWMTITGIFVGAAGGIAQLIAIAKRYMKDDR
jgi:F0F1-type ATP synthase assembly protein I